ncbi:MAG TPA: P-loop NTPase [Polyangia bacterium]
MNKPSVLILGADKESELVLRRTLKDVADLSGSLAAPDRVVDELRTLGAAAAIVVLSDNHLEGNLRQVSVLSQAGVGVVVVGASKDPDLILAAMRAGAREFVVVSDGPELCRAVAAQARPTEAASELGNLITIFPTRGGVGATTIAANVAGAMARRRADVCLLDFDLYLGDVLSFLDLPGSYSMTDVITNMRRLDRELLDTSIVRHASGVRVLAQSGKVEEAEGVRASDAAALLDFLRRHYSYLVVDGIAGFDELSLSILDASQQIVMVLTQDVPAVRSTKRCLDLFRRLGYDDRKIKLVLNRYQRSSKITADVIADTVGLPIAHTLSNDFASAIDSINRGMLLEDVAPRSPFTRDLEDLAPLLMGENQTAEPKRGFFRGLLSRKGNDGTPRAA